MKRSLYVDGSNLYGGMRDLLPPGSYFDFGLLLEIMRRDIPIDAVEFYGTYSRIESEQLLVVQQRIFGQAAFFNGAKSLPDVTFHAGYLSGGNQEKGIDMRLGLDLYIGARNHDFDEAILYQLHPIPVMLKPSLKHKHHANLPSSFTPSLV